jgi:hypothetical protein
MFIGIGCDPERPAMDGWGRTQPRQQRCAMDGIDRLLQAIRTSSIHGTSP